MNDPLIPSCVFTVFPITLSSPVPWALEARQCMLVNLVLSKQSTSTTMDTWQSPAEGMPNRRPG